MNLDHVVQGDASDANQPGHTLEGVTKKPTQWPNTWAVQLESRDGQSVPVGVTYQGVVDGKNVYALMTQSVGPGAGVTKESDAQEMCDNGVPFIRWFEKSNGQPTTNYWDTDVKNAPYTASGSETFGRCDKGCGASVELGVLPDWG